MNKHLRKGISLFVFLLITAATPSRAQVVINEFSCSNMGQYVDNHSDYEDWFELYNTAATTTSLAGYYLSDDSLNNLKWQIPVGVNITAHGFLRFWASGRNEVIAPSYHTNFKLTQTKNNSEFIVLSNPSGVIVDIVKLSQYKSQLGHSHGRSPDGSPDFYLFTVPTPNASNSASTTFLRYAAKPSYDWGPGFYSGSLTVTITNNEPNSTVRYTTDGTLPTTSSAIYSSPLTISTTTVLKAIAISSDVQIRPSFIQFSTYFMNVS
jgi:hypothetical protein